MNASTVQARVLENGNQALTPRSVVAVKVCAVCAAQFAPRVHNQALCGKEECRLENMREYLREYRQKPEVKERQREYRQKPEVKERQREYQEKPEVKERQREYHREYEKKPAGRANRRIQAAKRRALKAANSTPEEIASVTPAFTDFLRRCQEDRCAYCREPLHGGGALDHVLPVKHGGPHARFNTCWACKPCNALKHDALDWEFHLELTLALAFVPAAARGVC